MPDSGTPWHASAVVPVFNGAATLERCLASLSAQTDALREILVIDDGSADGSWDIVEAFARRDSRFVVQRHQENRGIARTLNEGIDRATGNAVLIVHQDCEVVGGDWVARGLGLLRERPKVCLSGWPEYPFAELTSVETAFGLLRDTFYVPAADREVLGFSEFKCDLLPKGALHGIAFDERFRASAEDQIMSVRLAEAGFLIERVRNLPYVQRFGNASSVGSQLRKEFAYGRTEGGALLRTGFRVATRSSGSGTSARRLANRASVLLFGLGLVSIAVLALLRDPWLLVLPLPLLVPRLFLVARRGLTLRRESSAPRRVAALALALLPVNDVLYSAAVVTGVLAYAALRRA